MNAGTDRAPEIVKTDIVLPPPAVSLTQDHEWCLVRIAGRWKRIRFHDYEEIYEVPGLYEALFRDLLQCRSPQVVREALESSLETGDTEASDLRVLDLGAGNGLVGEELADFGADKIVAIDILEQAAAAARRDRGGVYEDYLVCDMERPSEATLRRLRRLSPNCLACVAALGFGDIPTKAFLNSFNLVEDGGWIVFNIKQHFLESGDSTGFSRLIEEMIASGAMSICFEREYVHRLATNGEPIRYRALVGVKKRGYSDRDGAARSGLAGANGGAPRSTA